VLDYTTKDPPIDTRSASFLVSSSALEGAGSAVFRRCATHRPTSIRIISVSTWAQRKAMAPEALINFALMLLERKPKLGPMRTCDARRAAMMSPALTVLPAAVMMRGGEGRVGRSTDIVEVGGCEGGREEVSVQGGL
jgi:hypothetical protein